ncbi:MAG: hypothetical protein HQM00_06130 [Magnetococcales bacterium]|nr:hypothetical protein [Magnetococcales bacterium]
MSSSQQCIVCKTHADAKPIGLLDKAMGKHTEWDCPRCGKYITYKTSDQKLRSELSDDVRAKISGWIRDQNKSGIAELSLDSLENAIARSLPSVTERASRLLIEAVRGQPYLGKHFNSREPRFIAATYSKSQDEVNFLMRVLADQNLAKHIEMGGTAEILPNGYFRVDELSLRLSASSQGFVAMWFDEELQDSYAAGFEKGILHAGYDPMRIDQVEHVNRIDDEIISQIKKSRFVVADFTGHRGGVYFEAGFALGMNLPVIWTCRQDYMKDLHFDIRQFNCINWDTPANLADRLQKRIEALLGTGPKKLDGK